MELWKESGMGHNVELHGETETWKFEDPREAVLVSESQSLSSGRVWNGSWIPTPWSLLVCLDINHMTKCIIQKVFLSLCDTVWIMKQHSGKVSGSKCLYLRWQILWVGSVKSRGAEYISNHSIQESSSVRSLRKMGIDREVVSCILLHSSLQ